MFERLLGISVCAGLLMSACGDDETPEVETPKGTASGTGDAGESSDAASADETARFVGSVEDTDVRLAVLAQDSRIRMFFCGGDSSFETATRWFFQIEVAGGEAKFDEQGWYVEVSVKDDGVSGLVARDDEETRTFTALPVERGTIAGLYEGYADCGRMGLIITQTERDGEISAQGACVGGAELPKQVNPIMPIAAEDGKIPVHTPDAEGETSLLVPSQLLPL